MASWGDFSKLADSGVKTHTAKMQMTHALVQNQMLSMRARQHAASIGDAAFLPSLSIGLAACPLPSLSLPSPSSLSNL